MRQQVGESMSENKTANTELVEQLMKLVEQFHIDELVVPSEHGDIIIKKTIHFTDTPNTTEESNPEVSDEDLEDEDLLFHSS